MNRYFVNATYLAALGQVSEILDRESTRRILVAGKDHAARAQRRADALNAALAAVEPRTEPQPCCPGARRPRLPSGS